MVSAVLVAQWGGEMTELRVESSADQLAGKLDVEQVGMMFVSSLACMVGD